MWFLVPPLFSAQQNSYTLYTLHILLVIEQKNINQLCAFARVQEIIFQGAHGPKVAHLTERLRMSYIIQWEIVSHCFYSFSFHYFVKCVTLQCWEELNSNSLCTFNASILWLIWCNLHTSNWFQLSWRTSI